MAKKRSKLVVFFGEFLSFVAPVMKQMKVNIAFKVYSTELKFLKFILLDKKPEKFFDFKIWSMGRITTEKWSTNYFFVSLWGLMKWCNNKIKFFFIKISID